jgi:uncharacterized protein YegP (UPF0339 family)
VSHPRRRSSDEAFNIDGVVAFAMRPVPAGAKPSKEKSMNPMRFKIIPAKGGWRVHYQSVENGKTIFWTQVYNDVRDARYAVRLARWYAATAAVVEVKRTYGIAS